jgi:hypothetical protein
MLEAKVEADTKWYFAVADVVQALTDSANVRDYIKKMRKREQELNANWGTLCPPLNCWRRIRRKTMLVEL